MKFLVMMLPGTHSSELGERVLAPKYTPSSGQDLAPAAKEMAKMGQFNDELEKVGALLSVNGLLPARLGARVGFAGGKVSVTDGPFTESNEVVGGFWILQAESKQQVVDWFKRCPAQPDDRIEIRPIAEMSDFSPNLRAALGSA